jgi:ATP-binding cassette subfamily F protein 3
MYLKITNAGVSINEKTILEEINLEIKEKSHIAVIGRNGAGKTTLLKALINNDLFESGVGEEKFNIFRSGKFEIGYLSQFNNINENKTLLEEILSVYKNIIDLEKNIERTEEKLANGASEKEIENYEELLEKYKLIGGYEYKKEYSTALINFGFKNQENKLISEFSGGEKTKIAFLKMLLSKPDLLLLDEPTNHLDIDAIEWLEEYLKKYPKSLIVISHDRMFINKIANIIIEIEYGKSEVYHGNYDYYKEEKNRRYVSSLKDYEYQQKEIKRLQSIADRFRYKPSKASMAMSKLKMIERMTKLSPPEKENLKTFNIKWTEFKESGKVVLKVNNLSVGYDKVLNTSSFELIKKERLGIIGENGTGKSTILKTIMGIIPKLNGDIEFGSNVTIGYFDQEQKTLNEGLTIYEEFKSKFPEMNDFEIRKSLASFLFYNEDLDKKIEVLSGGEKVRLELCEVIIKKPNLLILDEPTNHLDILSKVRLEEILKDYPGTILFVSHDRMFINNIANVLLVLKNKEAKYYNYNYAEYLERVKEEEIILENKIETKKSNSKPKNLKSNEKKEIKKIEIEIKKKEEKIKELQSSLYEPSIYNDYNKVNEINNEINKLEEELLELMTKLEEINSY